MKKMLRCNLILILLIVFTIIGTDVFAFSITYDSELYFEGSTRPYSTSKIKAKDGLWRSEHYMEGAATEVSIINSQGLYIFYLTGDRGVFITKDRKQFEQTREDLMYLSEPGKYLNYLKAQQQGRLVSSEIIDGYECDVYEFQKGFPGMDATAGYGNMWSGKVWLWKERAYPYIRIEFVSPWGRMVRKAKNIQLDIPIPDSEFEVPAKVKFEVPDN